MEKKRFQKLKILFILLFVLASIAPFVLMPWFGNQEAESQDSDVALTPLFVEGKLNKGFFTDETGKFNGKFAERAGDYFSKKFAFRREMVDAGDTIKAEIFKTSGQDGVVVGRDGYLFYKDSFDNFLGRDQFTDHEIYSLAQNVKLMQELLNEQGISFMFTIAPNKNTLYPDLMPEKYDPDVDNRNISRLTPAIDELGIRYTDLYKLFNGLKEKKKYKDKVMYLKGDSHWNNIGASLVTKELMSSLGRGSRKHGSRLKGGRTKTASVFKGDLYQMLYPATNRTDENYYDSDMEPKEYQKRVTVKIPDVKNMGMLTEIDQTKETEWSASEEIETEHKEDRDGTLLMIRDSFGNSLSPYIADEFSSATFLNNTPYDLDRAVAEKRETVIFEIVERNLDRILNYTPLISGIENDASKEELKKYKSGRFLKKRREHEYDGELTAELSEREMGYIHINGKLDPEMGGPKARYLIAMKDKGTGEIHLVRAFRTRRGDTEDPDNAYGVSAYISAEDIPYGRYELYLIARGRFATGTLGTFDYKE